MPEHSLPATFGHLIEAAKAASLNAYAPYSGLLVGAAVLGGSGCIYLGCNVENASFPVGLCAERGAVATALAAGEAELVAVAVAGADSTLETLVPCGLCLQFLSEWGADLSVVSKQEGRWLTQPVTALLPQGFRFPAEEDQGDADARLGADGLVADHGRPVTAPVATGETALPEIRLQRLLHPEPGDLEELGAREVEAFGAVGLRSYDLAVMVEAGAVYRAYRDESFVGACQLLRMLDAPDALYLVGFYVVPAWRGRGTGRAFLRALLGEVGALGASSLLLTVAPDNQIALDLYRDEGFVVVCEVPGFYGPGADRLLLQWRRAVG